jgi:hypothetical protein
LVWYLLNTTIPSQSDGIDWRKGIKLIPSGLGLPDRVDQCNVVPIVAKVSGVDPDNKNQIGSFDDMASLPEIDKSIFGILFADFSEELVKLVRTEDVSHFTIKEKSENLTKLGWKSFSYFGLISVFKSNLEMRDCSWWNESTPKECTVENTKTEQPFSVFKEESKIQFWMNGYLKSGVLKYKADVPEDQSLNQSVKVECYSGAIRYRFDGSLESCEF